MFLNDLFTIQSEQAEGTQTVFSIRLNGSHPIYGAHFPGSPITPGVCIVQIAVDLFSHLQGHVCRLAGAKNVKFLQVIKPDEYGEVSYSLSWELAEEGLYKVKVMVSAGEVVFAKMSLQIAG